MKRFIMGATAPFGLVAAGCLPGLIPVTETPTGLAGEVATKAETIASLIGGAEGFGGVQLEGYRNHMADHMGFRTLSDLADASSGLTVRLHNDADEECAFQIVYAASHMGLVDETMQVVVQPGATETVELPCVEMIGLGSMTEVGATACELADGTEFDNRMCVPGFMNSDYQCDGVYECFFGPDSDDLDGDGDTTELIATTQALHQHMGSMGMMMHGGHGP